MLLRWLFEKARWISIAAIVGAVVFVLVEELAGRQLNMPQFIGNSIVNKSGISIPGFIVGWVLHIAVCFAYAALYGIASFSFGGDRQTRLIVGAVVALVLGFIASAIAGIASNIAISILSGNGFPAVLGDLNLSAGLPLWNHLLLFGIFYFFIIYLGERQPIYSRR